MDSTKNRRNSEIIKEKSEKSNNSNQNINNFSNSLNSTPINTPYITQNNTLKKNNSKVSENNNENIKSAKSIKSSRSALSTGSKARQIFRIEKNESKNNVSLERECKENENSFENYLEEDGIIAKNNIPLTSPDKRQVPISHIYNPFIEMVRDQGKITRPVTQIKNRLPNMKYIDANTRNRSEIIDDLEIKDDLHVKKVNTFENDKIALPSRSTSGMRSRNSTF